MPTRFNRSGALNRLYFDNGQTRHQQMTLDAVTIVYPGRLELYARLFGFSSRRRHTSGLSDWSSDVCSSDLPSAAGGVHDELETVDARRDRHQRDRAVRVLPGRDGTLPFSEVEPDVVAFPRHVDVAERVVVVRKSVV